MLTPNVWGKYFWTTFHISALGFPDQPTDTDREEYKSYYMNFGNGLPCPKCKNNYSSHFKEFPIEFFLYGKSELFDWTVKLHNIVNKEQNKKEWTFDEAWDWYMNAKFDTQKSEKCITISSYPYILVLLIANLILFLILVLYSFK